MGKKTLILSQRQLDEIVAGNPTYLDGMADTPDMSGSEFSTEISSDGSVDTGYADATTTDDYASDMTNDWRGNAKLHGMGPITVREGVAMKLSDWKKLYLEEKEHGNQRLNNMQFGAKDGEKGKSYGATKTALCRKRAVEKTMQTGGTPEIKAAAAKRLNSMKRNWKGIDNAATQYKAAKENDAFAVADKPTGTKKATSANGLPKIEGGTFIN